MTETEVSRGRGGVEGSGVKGVLERRDPGVRVVRGRRSFQRQSPGRDGTN